MAAGRPSRLRQRPGLEQRLGVAALLVMMLSGCDDVRDLVQRPTPQSLANSLIFATRELCVPYVVDGKSIASLTQRSGIAERRLNVNGVLVTRYVVQKPGSPAVTLLHSEAAQDYCAIWMESVRPSDQRATVALFARDLRLTAWATSKPHKVPTPGVLETNHDADVMCVHGKSNALVAVTNPPESDGVSIEVHVLSDPTTNKAAGCM